MNPYMFVRVIQLVCYFVGVAAVLKPLLWVLCPGRRGRRATVPQLPEALSVEEALKRSAAAGEFIECTPQT